MTAMTLRWGNKVVAIRIPDSNSRVPTVASLVIWRVGRIEDRWSAHLDNADAPTPATD